MSRASYAVRPFDESCLSQAAELLAQRHRGDRRQFPILPASYESPDACIALLRSVMGYARGIAAISADGEMAGFMHAVRNLPDPTSGSARFAPTRSMTMLGHAHACSEREDPAEVYHALYTAMAEGWVRDGIFDHVAHVPVGHLEPAWASLGFGRRNVFAARNLAPLEGSEPAAEIRQAEVEDIDTVLRLVSEEARFHSTAPIFRPFLGNDTAVAVRAELTRSLADEGQAIFIARHDGADAGVVLIGPGRGSPLFLPERAAYIGDTAVLGPARGRGVGAALVQAALAWGRENGYEHATLHYASANALSRSFWPGVGFIPVMWHLARQVDERIAWARP